MSRVVLVTGGARGIGRAIVQRLAADGARVCIVDMDVKHAREVVAELGDERCRFVRASVASEPDARRAVADAVAWGGRLDGLVNDAAIADPDVGPIEKLSLATWKKFIDTNLTSVFLFAKHAAKHLRETKGAIVNIGSTRAYMSERNTEPYAAAKGGITALTHALAISLGPDVRVNCISPGWIVTDPDAKVSKRDHEQHPVGRAGRPDDIAALCAWLLSDEAGFVTGQDVVADGGMTRKMIYV